MILWLFYIVLDALVNWYIIEKRKIVPNYIQLTIVRGWAFILIGIAINLQEWQLLWWFLFTATSFWLLFDILINLFRGKNIFYRGENSMIDKFGTKYPAVYFLLKLTALLILIYQI